ncbi:hypothetical protein JG687_00009257 [Phytophthora cactorum]|uniref:Uncharacterized protein n=1 Tax=Phytophthora cactorum TaxID=29920 RepID=A0A329RSU6_9STRA|nr:hypothetical protein Pcac1_g21504 [Phytophthora cactorum]KAG2811586.1 hypothetical protein PC112_g15542 [Phytophthora cactorum]KAG2815297.1 hypothetical protein PC111_g13632 [Phytophthora cactorum]KAG2865985.1 hypothetical protein PC113_g3245 [Phytophthora cactorum]KAG2891099.1 hypothetical protein PC114_g17134 [Phytophthora cactorum]
MEHREELELDALAMNAELSGLFNDFGCTEDTLLIDEVLDLPDLELLLPSEDLGDELLDSLLPDAANEENRVSAMECEEGGEGLTVSVDGSSSLAVEEQERELVVREVKFLEAQRDFLQFRAEATANGLQFEDWENEGKQEEKEKKRLEMATRQQTMLVDAMNLHKKSIGDLHRLMLQASPLMHYRMTLMTPMESFIRLGKNPAERRRKLLEMRDEKLDTVRRFVAAQTRGIDPTREFFYVDTFERFGKFYTVDFSVSLVNSVTVDEVAEVIQDQFVVPRDGVSRLLGCVTNRTYYDGMVDTFLHARTVERVDLPERSCVGRSFLVQESNAVFYLKRFDASELDGSDGGQLGEQGDLTVMMSDFVDVDELHPYHGSRVRKDISVGITLRRHVGPDGAESVVMRRFSFVKHHLGRRTTRPEVVNTISTRVLLWGQAVRLCIGERRRQKRDAPKRIWNTHTFPRRPPSMTPTSPQPRTACAGADQLI